MKESNSRISYMKVITYSLFVWSSQYAHKSSDTLCNSSCYKRNNRLLSQTTFYSTRDDTPVTYGTGGYHQDDELHSMSRRMNSAVKDAHFESKFQELCSEDNLQGSFDSMLHDENIQKQFNAIMCEGDYPRMSGNSYRNNEYYETGPGTRAGKHYNDYGRGRSDDYDDYKKGSGRKGDLGSLNYDKHSGNRDYSSGGGYYMDSGHSSRDQSALTSGPHVSEYLSNDYDRQAHPYQQNLETYQPPPNNFNTFDVTLNTHMPLSQSNAPIEELEIKHVLQKKKINKSAPLSVIEGFIKFIKKVDAMYETEILRIMTGTTGAYDGQHVEQKKNKGLIKMLKDKINIFSPVISIAFFVGVFALFNIMPAVVVTSVILIATMIYVWYKYKKCKRINKMYAVYDEQKLMQHSAQQKMEALQNSRYIG
ncbi:Pv-fam-d protein [Plasmodium coatneyi]|uniref:Pv-fam-d protein n=1 Tax=Plasmodium coatneyi TaxID=208452 RepID=A0A1B1E882_9APIC|nr:Pv-fam-d protein [Plasmodium coatneyi]ANQ10979.1 Pv-fam-d protein [Plasmodium coatneyi]